MVVKLIKWRPWPTIQSKKFEAKIVVNCMTGIVNDNDDEKIRKNEGFSSDLMVEINWKGSKLNGFRSLKNSVKKNCTNPQKRDQNGVVLWDEEFKVVCGFCGSKDQIHEGVFLPWDVVFLVFNLPGEKKVPLAAPVVVNLAEFVSLGDAKELDLNIPLTLLSCDFRSCPSLCISLKLTELRTATNELPAEVQRPLVFAPLSPCFGATSPSTKTDEGSSFKASLRKVKSWTDFVSSRKPKKTYPGGGSSDGKISTGSDSDYNYPFDTDSSNNSEDGESEESTSGQNSCSYGSLVHVNFARGALDLKVNCEDDEFIYYSNKRLKVDSSSTQEVDLLVSEQLLKQSKRFGILAWRKKKLNFRSARVKGEPLLKKDYGEEGGDDIDFDRRQLSSDESMVFDESVGGGSLFSEFGDDNFAIGSWEVKELPSRDGSMKLRTSVFFASIDQRSERAAGESACTTLVAVIADWLHANRGEMPIKSDFDSLIREGSLEWRNLCENEIYMEKFPDKHFDLETVLEAKIRPLTILPEKSFIGFFHPEGLEEESFHFLKGAMSFDDIWSELSQLASGLNRESEPLVYVVSWNDHFFLLRVDCDAFYIIDTLGERLFEGCNQAFVLKFDKDTTIEELPDQTPTKDEKDKNGDVEGVVAFKGIECCKEYIKSFLAAIPIRELQVDMKKGLVSSAPLHHRLQVEFNFTAQVLPPPEEKYIADVSTSMIVDVQGLATDYTAATMTADVSA